MAPVSKLVGPLDGATEEIGAIEGMKMQEKPSWRMSNSIKGGSRRKLTEESLGVAMLMMLLIRERAMARSVWCILGRISSKGMQFKGFDSLKNDLN